MSKPCCKKCPVSDCGTCLAIVAPDRFGYYCEWAETDDDMKRRIIIGRSEIETRRPMPSLVQQAANFVGAVVGHVAAGAPTASQETRDARLAICRTNECGFYREGDRCGHGGCGCYLTVKASWAEQRCPLDPPRWEAAKG